jgi:Ca-activated chloride channel homolog
VTRVFPGVVCLLVAVATPCASQSRSPGVTPHVPTAPVAADLQSGPTFRTGIDLVALTVTVTDAERRLVGDLTAQDFRVFEDGVQQPLSFFGISDVPLDVALLVDASASMQPILPQVRDAATGLLQTLRAQDRASLVEFRNGVRVAEALTHDIGRVTAAVNAITASGGTSLYNALYVTLKEFQRLSRNERDIRRRTIVVLSDGEDTGSLIPFEEVLDLARRSGVTIYTVALKSDYQLRRQRLQTGGRRYFSQADYTMRVLADETGARAFFPNAVGELKDVYEAVATELASQYALGYVSRNPIRNGAWRRLLVQIVQHPGTRPRTRSGYFAVANAPVRVAER